jgi:hypothetical protein
MSKVLSDSGVYNAKLPINIYYLSLHYLFYAQLVTQAGDMVAVSVYATAHTTPVMDYQIKIQPQNTFQNLVKNVRATLI